MRQWIEIVVESEQDFFYPNEEAVTETDLRYIFDGTFFMAAGDRMSSFGAALVNSLKGDDRIHYFNKVIIPIYEEHKLPKIGKPPFLAFQRDVSDRWAAMKSERVPGVDYTDYQVVLDFLMK